MSASQNCEMSMKSLLHLVATPRPRKQLRTVTQVRDAHELHASAFFRAARVPTWLLGLHHGSGISIAWCSVHPRAVFPAHL